MLHTFIVRNERNVWRPRARNLCVPGIRPTNAYAMLTWGGKRVEDIQSEMTKGPERLLYLAKSAALLITLEKQMQQYGCIIV